MRFQILAALPLTLAIAACGDASAPAEDAGSEDAIATASDDTAADTGTLDVGSAVVIPVSFHGTYDSDGASCDATDDSSLTIAAETVSFHESTGKVASVDGTGNTIDVTLEMTGEGESFTRAYQITLSDGGDTLAYVGEGMAEAATRQRCFTPDV